MTLNFYLKKVLLVYVLLHKLCILVVLFWVLRKTSVFLDKSYNFNNKKEIRKQQDEFHMFVVWLYLMNKWMVFPLHLLSCRFNWLFRWFRKYKFSVRFTMYNRSLIPLICKTKRVLTGYKPYPSGYRCCGESRSGLFCRPVGWSLLSCLLVLLIQEIWEWNIC